MLYIYLKVDITNIAHFEIDGVENGENCIFFEGVEFGNNSSEKLISIDFPGTVLIQIPEHGQ